MWDKRVSSVLPARPFSVNLRRSEPLMYLTLTGSYGHSVEGLECVESCIVEIDVNDHIMNITFPLYNMYICVLHSVLTITVKDLSIRMISQ